MFLNFLKCMLQLILSPTHGWEDISADGRDEHALVRGGLYPFLVLTGLSAFAGLLFKHDLAVIVAVQRAAVIFVAYFASYFFAMFMLSFLLRGIVCGGEVNERRLSTFVSYVTALLALLTLIGNCLPTSPAVMGFLPIYVLVILWKGWRYMAVVPGRVIRFVIMGFVTVILPPYLLRTLFNLIVG